MCLYSIPYYSYKLVEKKKPKHSRDHLTGQVDVCEGGDSPPRDGTALRVVCVSAVHLNQLINVKDMAICSTLTDAAALPATCCVYC